MVTNIGIRIIFFSSIFLEMSIIIIKNAAEEAPKDR